MDYKKIYEEFGDNPNFESLLVVFGKKVVHRWAINGYKKYIKAKVTKAKDTSKEKIVNEMLAKATPEQIEKFKQHVANKIQNFKGI